MPVDIDATRARIEEQLLDALRTGLESSERLRHICGAAITLADALAGCDLPRNPQTAMRWAQGKFVPPTSPFKAVYLRMAREGTDIRAGFSFQRESEYAPLLPEAPAELSCTDGAIPRTVYIAPPPHPGNTVAVLASVPVAKTE